MTYRTTNYKGETMKKLKAVIEEIEEKEEDILTFFIEVY